MPIFRGSRYEGAIIDYFSLEQNGDSNPVLFYTMSDIGTIEYTEYEWKDGDRLDLIANKFYGRSNYWWFILENNPEIRDPENINAGTILRIVNA
jgi:hypothetical protein